MNPSTRSSGVFVCFTRLLLAGISLALLLSSPARGGAEDKAEATAAGARPSAAKASPAVEAKGPEVGEVRLRTLAPVTYAYVATETTFDQLGTAISQAIPELMEAAAKGRRSRSPGRWCWRTRRGRRTPRRTRHSRCTSG